MEKITTVGIDLVTSIFQVHAIDASGRENSVTVRPVNVVQATPGCSRCASAGAAESAG